MASRMAGVGLVTVSLRRSISFGVWCNMEASWTIRALVQETKGCGPPQPSTVRETFWIAF